MKIKQLQLQNYGRFEHLTIDFAPTEDRASNVTVIVGNNGAGKSQILQALGVLLSWSFPRLTYNFEEEGWWFTEKYIRNGQSDSQIELLINTKELDKSLKEEFEKISLTLKASKDTSSRNVDYVVEEINFDKFLKQYRNGVAHSKMSLPLTALYPVERNLNFIKSDFEATSEFDIFSGNDNAINELFVSYKDFFTWFRMNEDLENELKIKQSIKNNINSQSNELKNHGKSISFKIDEIVKKISESVDKKTKIDLNREQLNLLENLNDLLRQQLKLLESNKSNLNVNIKQIKLDIVRKAIEEFTDFKNPHIRRQGTPTMIVEKDSEELDVNQLSQGEKSLLALVGDIARRLAILNPSLDDPLQGEGVVMIDEVDLHLHPKWQHDLTDKLVRTFPNVQFILTTHSPLIVSDRADILVYLLDDGNLRSIDNIYGEDANTLLNDIFYVPPRTPEVEETFNAIRRAISNKELNNADEQIQQIAKRLSPSNNELLKLRLMLAHAKLAQNKVS